MKKYTGSFITALLAAALSLLAPGIAVAAGDDGSGEQAQGRRCTLAGTWIGENDAGFVFLITVVPLDSAHLRYSTLADADANPPLGDLFPGAVESTAFHGTAVRTGTRTFEQTALAYVRSEDGWIGTFAVSGSWELSAGCDVAAVVWQGGALFPWQDPLVDPPFFCLPEISGTYRRVPVVPSSCAS